MQKLSFRPRIIDDNPLFKKNFEELIRMPMYKNIGDFFEGMFVSFEEKEFDTGVLLDKCSYGVIHGESVFSFMKEYFKDPMFHFKFKAIEAPTKEGISWNQKGNYVSVGNLAMAFMFKKPLFYDKSVIGSIKFYSSIPQSDKLDYNFGKTFGKKVATMGTFIEHGLGKEIFNSVVMYILSRYYASKSKSKGKLDIRCDLDTSERDEEINLSIAGGMHDHLMYSTGRDFITDGQKDYLITPDLLKKLSSGILNKKDGKNSFQR